MKSCKECSVTVDSPVTHCPLCYATLIPVDNHPEPLAYPDLQYVHRYNIVLRILLFLSLTVSLVCLTINILTFRTVWWSLIVIANIVYLWISLSIMLRRHATLGYKILVQGLSLGALLLFLDRLLNTQVNWAFNYALPFLFFSATFSITIIAIVKRMAIRDFILYFILTALLGFLPLLLMAFGLVSVRWPSLVSALYSALSLVSIFIFADSTTKIELKKRFHI